jgi:flagellar biosynthesis anti-sigma factor FlgM
VAEEKFMRIDLNQASPGLSESSRADSQGSTSVGNQSSANGVLGEDQAQLSGTHAQVQVLTAQALQLPEVRQEKVNALRQVVQEGSYQPSSDQIAEAVFNNLQIAPAA